MTSPAPKRRGKSRQELGCSDKGKNTCFHAGRSLLLQIGSSCREQRKLADLALIERGGLASQKKKTLVNERL